MSKLKNSEVERLTKKLAEVDGDLAEARQAFEAAKAVTPLSAAQAYLAGRGVAVPAIDEAAQRVATIQEARRLVDEELARARHRQSEQAYEKKRSEHTDIARRLADGLQLAREALDSEAALLRELRPFCPVAIAWTNHPAMYRALLAFDSAKFARDQRARGFNLD